MIAIVVAGVPPAAAAALSRHFSRLYRHPFPYLPLHLNQSLYGSEALRNRKLELAAVVASLTTHLLPQKCDWADYCPAVQEVAPSISAEFAAAVVVLVMMVVMVAFVVVGLVVEQRQQL